MGFVSALLGDANPISRYVADNRNTIHGAFAGFGQGTDLGSGFANAARGAQAGQTADDAWAQQQAAEDKRVAQINSTAAFLRAKGQEDLAAAVEGGFTTGTDAFNTWYAGSQPKTPEAYTLGPGETRYQGDQIIAQGPEDTKAGFGNEKDLAAQYAAQDPIKTYQAVRNSYERVRSSAEMGSKNPDAAGASDLSLIFAYMKMLDPTSVVREGEQASASNVGGVPAQVMNTYNSLINGGKLTEGVRQQFVQSADAIYKDAASNLDAANSQFSTRAQGWNVDPSNFIQQPEQYPAFGGAPAAPAWTAPNGNTVRAIP